MGCGVHGHPGNQQVAQSLINLSLTRLRAAHTIKHWGIAMDYAIFATGNKQYRVKPGDVIDVDKLVAEEGSSIELSDVRALSWDGETILGTPTVPEASVIAQVTAHDRDKKIIVFKYKRKVRYRRKKGHRQHYTRLAITSIVFGNEEIGIPEWAPEEVVVPEESPPEQPSDVLVEEPQAELIDEQEDTPTDELTQEPTDTTEEELQEDSTDEPSNESEDRPTDELSEEPVEEQEEAPTDDSSAERGTEDEITTSNGTEDDTEDEARQGGRG